MNRWGIDRTFAAIAVAAFTMSAAGALFLVAAPFVIKHLGGTDGDVGTSFALNFVAYFLSCLVISFVINRFNPKRSAQLGAIGCALAVFGMVAIIYYADSVTHPIMLFNICVIMVGILTALFWPPLVGWLSAQHEGQELNRRLGSFNMAWSSGSWISPWIGGVLVAVNASIPMAIAAAIMVLCFISLRFAKNPARIKQTVICAEMPVAEVSYIQHDQLDRFKWIARIALVAGFICVGLVRSQMGLLFKFELGYSESSYGIAITLMALANFVTFWIAGRSHQWHYKKWHFVASEAGLVVSMAIILSCKGLVLLFVAATIVGVMEGFLYAAHLFYGLTGSKQRSSLMAVHEFLLSIGLVAGSFLGGQLSDAFGRYMPYKFGVVAIAVAAAIQIAAWFIISSRKQSEA